MSSIRFPRRRFLALSAASLGGTLLTGCDRLSESSDVQEGLSSAEWLTYRVQRLLGGRHALAREFTASDVSPVFKVNGRADSGPIAGTSGMRGSEWDEYILLRS